LYFIYQAFGITRSYDRHLILLFNPHDTTTDHAPTVRSTQSTNPMPFIATRKISQHNTLTASGCTCASPPPQFGGEAFVESAHLVFCPWSAFFSFSLSSCQHGAHSKLVPQFETRCLQPRLASRRLYPQASVTSVEKICPSSLSETPDIFCGVLLWNRHLEFPSISSPPSEAVGWAIMTAA